MYTNVFPIPELKQDLSPFFRKISSFTIDKNKSDNFMSFVGFEIPSSFWKKMVENVVNIIHTDWVGLPHVK